MLLGLAMVAGSGWLIFENKSEEAAAGSLSEVALLELKESIAAAPKSTPVPMITYVPGATPEPAQSGDFELTAPVDEAELPALAPEATVPVRWGDPTPVPEMPTMTIGGQQYIGYLELPTIALNLPVMSDWSYPQLRKAPCRYTGSAYEDNMVIMAHNYERHFGNLTSLNIGDPVQFVDAQGSIFRYRVAAHETLAPTDVAPMVDNAYDLTLFTCTYGGASRITVRLERVLTY